MKKFTLALAAFLTPAFLSVPAFASDFVGDGEQQGGGRYSIERVVSAMDDLVDVMVQVFAVMMANPLLVVFLAASLLMVGIAVFRRIKRAARG